MGRDTRLSGTMLAAATAAGICSAGVHVTDCGVITTPGLCLLTRNCQAAGAVMISSSHNPPSSNGIKLVDCQGDKLPDEAEQQIESLVFADENLAPHPTGEKIGTISRRSRCGERYLDLLFADLGAEFSLQGLKVVMDCAWGAAFEAGPHAFTRAGACTMPINAQPQGARINVDCGALYPQGLAEEVVSRGADLGVAFDGDGDRVILVDHAGTVRNGDYIKFVLAEDMQSRGVLEPAVVVGTVMSNLGLELALRDLGIELVRAPVGDRYVKQQMRAHQALLGGEQSGHIVFSQTGIGDGIYTALRVCDVMVRRGRSLAELCAPLHPVPQMLINVPVKDKYAWERSEKLAAAVRRWRDRLAGEGRILIRPSGTEPLVRVMVEALDENLALQAAESLAELIADQFGYGELFSEEENS